MSGRLRGEAFWLEMVAAWRQSGKSASAFARARGVAPSSFAYWVEREAPPVGLVRVERAAEQCGGIEVCVGACVVRVGAQVTAGWLAEFVRQVAGS